MFSQVQSFLLVEPVDPLMVNFPPFTQQQDMNPSISISLPYRGYFLDSHSQKDLLVAGWLPPVPSPVD